MNANQPGNVGSRQETKFVKPGTIERYTPLARGEVRLKAVLEQAIWGMEAKISPQVARRETGRAGRDYARRKAADATCFSNRR